MSGTGEGQHRPRLRSVAENLSKGLLDNPYYDPPVGALDDGSTYAFAESSSSSSSSSSSHPGYHGGFPSRDNIIPKGNLLDQSPTQLDAEIGYDGNEEAMHWTKTGLCLFGFAAPSAVLGAAYSIGTMGLVLGPVVLVIVTIASARGAIMLLAILDAHPGCTSFGDLGAVVLGPVTAAAGGWLQMGNFLIYLPVALLMCADAAAGAFDPMRSWAFGNADRSGCDDYWILVVSALCLATTQLRTLENASEHLSFVSLVCVSLVCIIALCLVISHPADDGGGDDDGDGSVAADAGNSSDTSGDSSSAEHAHLYHRALLFGNPDMFNGSWRRQLSGLASFAIGMSMASWSYVPSFLTVELAAPSIRSQHLTCLRRSARLRLLHSRQNRESRDGDQGRGAPVSMRGDNRGGNPPGVAAATPNPSHARAGAAGGTGAGIFPVYEEQMPLSPSPLRLRSMSQSSAGVNSGPRRGGQHSVLPRPNGASSSAECSCGWLSLGASVFSLSPSKRYSVELSPAACPFRKAIWLSAALNIVTVLMVGLVVVLYWGWDVSDPLIYGVTGGYMDWKKNKEEEDDDDDDDDENDDSWPWPRKTGPARALCIFWFAAAAISYALDSIAVAVACTRRWAPSLLPRILPLDSSAVDTSASGSSPALASFSSVPAAIDDSRSHLYGQSTTIVPDIDGWDYSVATALQFLLITLPPFFAAIVTAILMPSLLCMLAVVTALTVPWANHIYPAVLFHAWLHRGMPGAFHHGPSRHQYHEEQSIRRQNNENARRGEHGFSRSISFFSANSDNYDTGANGLPGGSSKPSRRVIRSGAPMPPEELIANSMGKKTDTVPFSPSVAPKGEQSIAGDSKVQEKTTLSSSVAEAKQTQNSFDSSKDANNQDNNTLLRPISSSNSLNLHLPTVDSAASFFSATDIHHGRLSSRTDSDLDLAPASLGMRTSSSGNSGGSGGYGSRNNLSYYKMRPSRGNTRSRDKLSSLLYNTGLEDAEAVAADSEALLRHRQKRDSLTEKHQKKNSSTSNTMGQSHSSSGSLVTSDLLNLSCTSSVENENGIRVSTSSDKLLQRQRQQAILKQRASSGSLDHQLLPPDPSLQWDEDFDCVGAPISPPTSPSSQRQRDAAGASLSLHLPIGTTDAIDLTQRKENMSGEEPMLTFGEESLLIDEGMFSEDGDQKRASASQLHDPKDEKIYTDDVIKRVSSGSMGYEDMNSGGFGGVGSGGDREGSGTLQHGSNDRHFSRSSSIATTGSFTAAQIRRADTYFVGGVGLVMVLICMAAAVGKLALPELRGDLQVGCTGWYIYRYQEKAL